MSIEGLTLKQSMSKNIQAIMPQEEDKMVFEIRMVKFLENLLAKKNESEEFQKNLLKDFLQICLPKNFINTNGRTDLAIYNGPSPESTVGVLFEFKSLSNKSEMISKTNYNAKAFQEIVHYYLNERLVHNNIEVKKCIITNGLEWFIFDAKEIEKHFMKNKKLIDLYNKWRMSQLSGTSTDFLYKEVMVPAINKAIENGLKLAHFNLTDALKKGDKIEIKKNNLTQLYRFFTPENLLNKQIFLDSNKLNKGFYDELLYLMGLEEVKVDNKKIIQRLPKVNRQMGSFVENIIDRLEMNDVPEEKQYEIAVQLTVVWVNRILFLKLLESQLITFNNDDKYRFLTKDLLHTFDDIYYLFFGVLAKKVHQRKKEMMEKFGHVPYLNSSLFEETKLEQSRIGIGIDRLRDQQIKFYTKTVLRGADGKRKTGKVDFLTYLFDFLNSFDFSTSIQHNKDDKNNLINAAVLGLIFEKINGYSDGAFFTPGRITMYMSRNIIRKAVVTKINEVKGWNCKNIYDVQFNITSIDMAKEISGIIDTIKICDPSVGSGHFLVSVLNELIAIKSELRVLIDTEGRSMNDIRCTVVNDELIIQDFNGDNFTYNKGNLDSERIQKAIFVEKRKLIENCLFGVDINTNSANICRLRLWIELLKSSYYYFDEESNEIQLATLPNIDINIKVGNSLLHKFGIHDNLDKRFSRLKEYTQLVTEYKGSNDKRKKQEIIEKIDVIKQRFSSSIETPEVNRMKYLRSLLYKVSQSELFEEKVDINKKKKEIVELEKKLTHAVKDYEASRKNPMFRKGLEWRMEFPEVLDNDGDFIGFDVIIANPPYIYSMNDNFTENEKRYFNKTYPLTSYQLNTFSLFIELAIDLLSENGSCAFIVPNTLLTLRQFSGIRKTLISNTADLHLINSKDKIFEDANIDNCIIFFKNGKPTKIKLSEILENEIHDVTILPPDAFKENDVFNISTYKGGNSDLIISATQTIELNSKSLYPNFADLRDGLKVYEKGKGNPPQPTDKEEFEQFKKAGTFFSKERLNNKYVPFLFGSNMNRYETRFNNNYLEYGDNLAAPRTLNLFQGERILIRKVSGKYPYALIATYVNRVYTHPQALMMMRDFKVNPFFILGCVNSMVQTFWIAQKYDMAQRKTFPQFRLYQFKELRIPNATEEEQEQLAMLVREQLDLHEVREPSFQEKAEMQRLDLKIDEYVMTLFRLNNNEKKSIRNFSVEEKFNKTH